MKNQNITHPVKEMNSLFVYNASHAGNQVKKLYKKMERNLYIMAGTVVLYIIMVVAGAYQIA